MTLNQAVAKCETQQLENYVHAYEHETLVPGNYSHCALGWMLGGTGDMTSRIENFQKSHYSRDKRKYPHFRTIEKTFEGWVLGDEFQILRGSGEPFPQRAERIYDACVEELARRNVQDIPHEGWVERMTRKAAEVGTMMLTLLTF